MKPLSSLQVCAIDPYSSNDGHFFNRRRGVVKQHGRSAWCATNNKDRVSGDGAA
jgi:hypothetical protein